MGQVHGLLHLPPAQPSCIKFAVRCQSCLSATNWRHGITTFVKLVQLYERQGYRLRSGLNPDHFSEQEGNDLPFTNLYHSGNLDLVCGGGGISPLEIYFLECLLADYRPTRIFSIGNAFGWSTLAISMIAPEAKTVCMDACQDAGYDEGRRLTNLIAAKEGLNACAVKGTSPRDVKTVVELEFSGLVDFVFIDGWHTNEQLLADFLACRRVASPECVYLFHDVVNNCMFDGFEEALSIAGELTGTVLMRTTSGMAIAYPPAMDNTLASVVTAFTQDDSLLVSPPLNAP